VIALRITHYVLCPSVLNLEQFETFAKSSAEPSEPRRKPSLSVRTNREAPGLHDVFLTETLGR
jgi:hypothetical protein